VAVDDQSMLYSGIASLRCSFCLLWVRFQILWTFSIYLEAVAIMPQLVLLQRTKNIDNLTGNYIFLLGSVAAFCMPGLGLACIEDLQEGLLLAGTYLFRLGLVTAPCLAWPAHPLPAARGGAGCSGDVPLSLACCACLYCPRTAAMWLCSLLVCSVCSAYASSTF